MAALAPFKLERFFAKHEFSAPHLLCCSDCEPLAMSELLAMADEDSMRRWNSLKLGYTETMGLPALREAVAELYSSASADDIIILAPEEGVYLAMLALLGPGDHVVASFPGYQSLYSIAEGRGCSVSRWEARCCEGGGLAFDFDQLKELVQPGHTKMVVVNFPHNPTGFLPSVQQWQQLVATCREAGAFLFSDEMYSLLNLQPEAVLPSAVDCYERAITLNGVSKSLGLPGARIGWLACREQAVLQRVAELKDYTTICSSAPSEVLALMALRARQRILAQNISIIHTNITAARQLIADFPDLLEWSEPAAGSVAFPRFKDCTDIEGLCERLVQKAGILLLPASVYDHDSSMRRGHFRLGLGRRDFVENLALLRVQLQTMRAAAVGNAES